MPDHEPHAPRGLVPGFELGGVIGRGGFATVYRARQVSLDRQVAVKIDSRVLDEERNHRRFLREATASAQVSSHPHVVSLIDAGTTSDNRPYLVMELCDNGSVGQLVKRQGPLPPPDVLELAISISSALAAAHEKGILHRDIKPSNIMIDAYGTPLLGDFGLAALPLRGEASVTLEALTPAYAAPEAFELAQPSKRADVWSLGATLYSILTGVAPRHSDEGTPHSVAEIVKELYAPLPPVLHVRGADPLLTTIWRATAPNPERRYADGAEFNAALVELRGQLGRAHGVLKGSEVTRMAPGGLQAQRFPRPLASSASGPSVPSGPSGLSTPPPSSPHSIASFDPPTRPRRAWPIVVTAVTLVGLAGGGALVASQLRDSTPTADQQMTTVAPDRAAQEEPAADMDELPDFVSQTPTEATCYVELADDGDGGITAEPVDCDSPHQWEVYAYGWLDPDTASPKLADVEQDPSVLATCTPEYLASYTDEAPDGLELAVLPPTQQEFDDDSRLFRCVASAGTTETSLQR